MRFNSGQKVIFFFTAIAFAGVGAMPPCVSLTEHNALVTSDEPPLMVERSSGFRQIFDFAPAHRVDVVRLVVIWLAMIGVGGALITCD